MAAGDVHTILNPAIRVAPIGTVFPTITAGGVSTPARSTTSPPITYPAGWQLVKRTGNGATITWNAPMQDITTDEVGVIGVVSAGTENVTVAFQTRTPNMQLFQYLAHLDKDPVASGAPAVAHDIYKMNVGGQPFMLAVEGRSPLGGLSGGTAGDKVLFIAHYCIQTENAQMIARTTGADAVVQPALTARALANPLTITQVPTTTGLVVAKLDERANLLIIP